MAELSTKNDTEAVIEAAQAAVEPTELETGKRYAFVLPGGANGAAASVKVVETEEYAAQPERKKGSVTVHTTEDLVRYLERHKLDGAGPADLAGITTVWVDQNAAKITAVVNDHAAAAAWRDHRALLPLQKTDAWEHWRRADGQAMSQEQFAEHVEEGLPEIAEPDGADLFEIVQTFHATNDVTFKQAVRLSSGAAKLEWDENLQASAGVDGELDIPTEFKLVVAPYVGEHAQEIIARLRFRVRERKLTLSYKLDRPDDFERYALELIATRLRQEFTHVYLGQPA